MKKVTILLFVFLFIISSGKSQDLSEKAKEYMENEITSQSNGALKLTDFNKENGVSKEVFGQKIYIFEYRLTIEVQKYFWKTSADNALEANWFWNNFTVLDHGSKGGWDDWSYKWKKYTKGNTIEITGEIEFENTDNGWRIKGYYKNKTAKENLNTKINDYAEYKTSGTGLKYKFFVYNKDAQKPKFGDVLTLNITYKLEETDSLLFNSDTAKLVLQKPLYNGDLFEGLALMAVGDCASFIVSADSFYIKNVGLEKLPEGITSGSNLVFEIKLKSIQLKADYEKEQKLNGKKEQSLAEERKAKEPDDINKYLKDNNIIIQPTNTGLYYIETLKGTGAKAENGKTVTLKYTGKLLDGTIFDSGNAPISFTLGSGQVVPGWEEGILMMRVGGKAKIIIPSSLAYGANGAGKEILPYSTLVMETELIDVK